MCELNIIGITRNSDCCNELQATASLSGLYLDDTTQGALPLKAKALKCNADTMEYFNSLRLDAVEEFKEMTLGVYSSINKPRYTSKMYSFPKSVNSNGTLTVSGTYAYTCLKSKNIRGAFINIKTLFIHGTSVIIKSNNTTFYDGLLSAFTGVDLPCDGSEYFIIYQPTEPVKNYKISCCGEAPPYEDYFTAGGGSTSSLIDLKFTHYDYSYGVLFSGYCVCNPLYKLCDIDFKNDPYGKVIARTILLIARKNYASWIMNSGKIDAYFVTNGDNIKDLILYYIKEIEDRMHFLAKNYTQSDCFCCGDIGKTNFII